MAVAVGYGLLFLLGGLLLRGSLALVFDPDPPLSETLVQVLGRGRWALFGAAGLLLATGLAGWTTRAGRRLLARNAVINGLLLAGALWPFAAAEYAFQPYANASIMMRDDALGWRLRPGTGVFAKAPVTINSKGLRGPEQAYDAPASRLRLLLLGDSVTFGHGIGADSLLFTDRTARRLGTALGRPAEAINAGVPAYMPWQYHRYLATEGVRFGPDLVVAVLSLNDVSEKLDPAFWARTRPNASTPAFFDALAGRSGLVWLTSFISHRLTLGGLNLGQRQMADVRMLLDQPEAAAVRRAWAETFTALDALTAFCQQRQVPLLLVLVPFSFQLDDPAAYDGPQRQVAAYTARRGVAYLDLLPLLAQDARTTAGGPEALYSDTNHLSPAGHARTAHWLAAYILEANLLAE